MYLYTNKSPLAAVVVNTGATSPVCSYAALKVIVLEPVPSCINSIERNCPVITPDAESASPVAASADQAPW